MRVDTERLIGENRDVWARFVPHPYMVKVVGDPGSLRPWVLEDYHFVRGGAIRFMLALASRAPPEGHLDFLLESTHRLATMEVPIFLEVSRDLGGVDLGREPSMATVSYVSFLNHLATSMDFVYGGAVALFAEEWAYYQAWKWLSGKSQHPVLVRLSSHWSSREFCEYVERLREMVEGMQGDQKTAAGVFRETCRFELLFWDSLNGPDTH